MPYFYPHPVMEFDDGQHLVAMKFTHLGPIAIFAVSAISFSILVLFDSTLTDSSYTRVLYVISQSKTCEKASELARADFNNGNCLLIGWGLPETCTIVAREVLLSDCGVELLNGGYTRNKEVGCYTTTMYELLQQQYGAEFYLQVRDKANRICAERKKSKSSTNGIARD